jgi:two-component system sensor histidine kinase YesM
MLQASTRNSNVGYGIVNVNDRIKLNYGNDYGLHFTSIYGRGTTVDIWLPVINNNNPEDYRS